MNATQLLERLTGATDDKTNLCVVLRSHAGALEALLVADELGRWSIPGGHANGNETAAQACEREVREETGLSVEVQPLLWTEHVARKIPANVFYAVVTGGDEIKPGGGDVTRVWWAPVNDLGAHLNGTDRLVVRVAANRVHDAQAVVEEAAMTAAMAGYATANVAAPCLSLPGHYIQLSGPAATSCAQQLEQWCVERQWPVSLVRAALYESTKEAVQRAHRQLRLTPMLEALLHTSDTLWHYEQAVVPQLRAGRIVLEVAKPDESARLLQRGLAKDILWELQQRVPAPTLFSHVEEATAKDLLLALKNGLEALRHSSYSNAVGSQTP